MDLTGRVQQANFDTYRPLLNEAPVIDVQLGSSTQTPGGSGERGTATIAPAVANATFAATGKHLRMLPVDPATLKSA